MKEKTFAEQMAYLSAAYERPLPRERAAVYWHQLGSLPDAAFVEAVIAHVGASRHWPAVSELRELTRAMIQKHGPAALAAPQISTVEVLRSHARLIGADEDKYINEVLNGD